MTKWRNMNYDIIKRVTQNNFGIVFSKKIGIVQFSCCCYVYSENINQNL